MIIEDCTGGAGLSPQSYGRDWALSRRWAVALDDGNLIFRDNEDLDNVDLDNEDLDDEDLDTEAT